MVKAELVLVGFGNVGRSFAKLVAFKKKFVEEKYGVKINIAAIVDSKGAVVKEEGFTPYELLKLCEIPRSTLKNHGFYGIEKAGVKEVYSRVLPDIHVEATPSNYVNGEPGVSHIFYALKRKVNVVTCNKAPLVLNYGEIMDLASKMKVKVKFKATVMAGTPLIDLLMSLKGYDVEHVRGILNSTANFILTEMHENLVSYGDALKKAQIMGIAEANPDLDVKGWDPAAKLVIISNVLGNPVRLNSIVKDDLSKLSLKDIYKAIREGYVTKFIAALDLRKGKGEVKLTKIPKDNVLASVSGTLNAVIIRTDVNEITLIGKGAGGSETAHAILDDVISIVQEVYVE